VSLERGPLSLTSTIEILERKSSGSDTYIVFLYTLYTGNNMFLYRGNTFVIYGLFVTNNIHMCMYIVTQVSRLLINRDGCVLSNPSSVIILQQYKTENTAVGIRHADHVTPRSIRKSWR
jgi:hypothetical protein